MPSRARALLATLILLIVAALAPALSPPATQAVAARRVPTGTLPQVSAQMRTGVPTTQELDMLVGAGITSVRTDVAWSWIEPQEGGAYQWSAVDPIFAAYRARGIEPQIIICCSPAWMAPYRNDYGPWVSWHAPTFGRMVGALVARYHPVAVEVSNEPDSAWPPAKAWVYALYLQQAYNASKAAWPATLVLSGGLAYEGAQGQSFVSTNAGALRDYTDLVAYHWYPPSQYGTQYPTALAKLDAIKAQLGGGKQYLLNEVGVDAQWNGWTEARQAADLVAIMRSLRARPGELVGAVWFSFRDEAFGPGFSASGVTRADNTPKPAYYALMAMAAEGSGCR